jgi:hypothetical protein
LNLGPDSTSFRADASLIKYKAPSMFPEPIATTPESYYKEN